MIKQISVFVENRSGALITITEALSAAGVDMRALSIADTQDFGILRIIVNDADLAIKTLGELNVITKVTDIIAVAVPDQPGGLSKILKILSDGGINIEYAYAFVSGSSDGAYVALRVNENEHAESLLRENGIREISEKDI